MHTPGPYDYDGPHNFSGILVCFIRGAISGNMKYGKEIAQTRYEIGEEEANDTARFIVTACNSHYELLEACQAMLVAEYDHDISKAAVLIKKAVAKATNIPE